MAIMLRAFKAIINGEFEGVARTCLEKELARRELEFAFLILFKAAHDE